MDYGQESLKVVMNNIKKGKVEMKVKRGKEVPVNTDRGVKLCQVNSFRIDVGILGWVFWAGLGILSHGLNLNFLLFRSSRWPAR